MIFLLAPQYLIARDPLAAKQMLIPFFHLTTSKTKFYKLPAAKFCQNNLKFLFKTLTEDLNFFQ